jgi:hypothetical protein
MYSRRYFGHMHITISSDLVCVSCYGTLLVYAQKLAFKLIFIANAMNIEIHNHLQGVEIRSRS